MGLSMNEKRAVLRQTFRRYQEASRREKSVILDEFTELTGYNRAYAALLLGSYGREVWRSDRKSLTKLKACDDRAVDGRGAPRQYDQAVNDAVTRVWYFCDCMCGKRLAPAIRTIVPVLQRWGELEITDEIESKLMCVSAATIDRMLREERRRIRVARGITHTVPGPQALRNQIPVRTFEEWDRDEVGHIQGDLVGHDGGYSYGEFSCTLNMVDIAIGWTESRTVRNKVRVWVCQAADDIRVSLPFDILLIGTDSGAEFINNHFIAWTKQHGLRFTRTRPYRKNDNCYVEERNNSFVRRVAGYLRYDTEEERDLLDQIYARQSILANYFYPSMKLTHKTRHGARVYRQYDTPQTPYQRLCALGCKSVDFKHLNDIFTNTNPAMLKREITELQQQLFALASNKPPPSGNTPGKELQIRVR